MLCHRPTERRSISLASFLLDRSTDLALRRSVSCPRSQRAGLVEHFSLDRATVQRFLEVRESHRCS
jgi:hypothetical protein